MNCVLIALRDSLFLTKMCSLTHGQMDPEAQLGAENAGSALLLNGSILYLLVTL
jgi:hypothetical protein